MRVQILDAYGTAHTIDSIDYDVIGRWFAGKAKQLQSANVTIGHPLRMDIWPEDEADYEALNTSSIRINSADDIFDLVKGLLAYSESLKPVYDE